MFDLPWPELNHYLQQQLAEPGTRLDEHSLMKGFLQQQDLQLDLLDPLALFRMHFCLRHHLYQLDRDWASQGLPGLDLGLLYITRQLQPEPSPSSEQQGLAKPDPLAAYYLDPDQLWQEDADSISELLRNSWQRLQAQQPEARAQALAELQLQDPLCPKQLKQRYRQLAQQQHPDRGGDSKQFVRLQQAYDLLKLSC